MKVYIVVKHEYIEGDLENYTQTHILKVCLNKELAINLQKKYFLQFLQNEKYIKKDELERHKKIAENFVGNTFNGNIIEYKDFWGVGLEEYDISEGEQK